MRARFAHILRQAYSPAWRAHQASAANQFHNFCSTFGLPLRPITATAVGMWIAGQLELGKKASSVATDVSALRTWCRVRFVPFLPTEDDEFVVAQALRGARADEDRPVRRPAAITVTMLHRLAQVVNWRDPHEHQLFVQALVSHDAMLRAGTTCGNKLRTEHVTVEADGSVRLELHKTKTTRLQADPSPVWLVPAASPANSHLDAARMLVRYMDRSGVSLYEDAPLFAKLASDGRVRIPFGHQTYRNWSARLRALCLRAGITAYVTPHALRAGGITDSVMGGVAVDVARRVGGWAHSKSTDSYIRAGKAAASKVRQAFSAQLTSSQ